MRRYTIVLVALFALLWQSVTLARPGSTVNVLTDREHAALHWHGEGHHHHEDGSYQLDNSNDAQFHAVSDHLTMTTALLPAIAHHFLASTATRPEGLPDARVAAPFLDGLLRPPRHTA